MNKRDLRKGGLALISAVLALMPHAYAQTHNVDAFVDTVSDIMLEFETYSNPGL